jgi:hypothetical protein
MPRRTLILDTLKHEDLNPRACPTRTIPDYDALYQRIVDNGGWTVLRTNPHEDRRTSSGAWESPLVKAFNCHVRTVLKQALHTRRLARDAWYMELGDKQGESK